MPEVRVETGQLDEGCVLDQEINTSEIDSLVERIKEIKSEGGDGDKRELKKNEDELFKRLDRLIRKKARNFFEKNNFLFRKMSVDLDDVIQVGRIAVSDAIENWSPDRILESGERRCCFLNYVFFKRDGFANGKFSFFESRLNCLRQEGLAVKRRNSLLTKSAGDPSSEGDVSKFGFPLDYRSSEKLFLEKELVYDSLRRIFYAEDNGPRDSLVLILYKDLPQYTLDFWQTMYSSLSEDKQQSIFVVKGKTLDTEETLRQLVDLYSTEEKQINEGQIAKIFGVGRAAVSLWIQNGLKYLNK